MGVLVVMAATGSGNPQDPAVRASSPPNDPVLSLLSETMGGTTRRGHLTADRHGVVAVVGDDGCSSSGGFRRWGHLTADGRGVVAVFRDGTSGNTSYSIVTAD